MYDVHLRWNTINHSHIFHGINRGSDPLLFRNPNQRRRDPIATHVADYMSPGVSPVSSPALPIRSPTP